MESETIERKLHAMILSFFAVVSSSIAFQNDLNFIELPDVISVKLEQNGI